MVNTIYVQLTGQLGNHLFQVATAYGLSKRHSMNVVICYNDYNQYESMYINSVFKKFKCIPRNQLNNQLVVYSEKSGGKNCWLYNPDIITNVGDYYLDGYFQNEKYFKRYKREFNVLFTSPSIINKILTQFPEISNKYFIHVRRGEYVGHKAYEIDYNTYFAKSINYILVKDPSAQFCVVSDEIEYCKRHSLFQTDRFMFIDNLDTLDTLHFMSLCTLGGICSNSSFSWWGSYLNTNPDKIVIMPRQWMANSNIFDVWPEDTIIIECHSENQIDKI
jgi:hypothetical protein